MTDQTFWMGFGLLLSCGAFLVGYGVLMERGFRRDDADSADYTPPR